MAVLTIKASGYASVFFEMVQGLFTLENLAQHSVLVFNARLLIAQSRGTLPVRFRRMSSTQL